jgi:hypothetical protein
LYYDNVQEKVELTIELILEIPSQEIGNYTSEPSRHSVSEKCNVLYLKKWQNGFNSPLIGTICKFEISAKETIHTKML